MNGSKKLHFYTTLAGEAYQAQTLKLIGQIQKLQRQKVS
jgi:hypothetical protein